MALDYSIVEKYLKFTNDFSEMEWIGRQIANDYSKLYSPIMMKKMYEGVERHIPDADIENKESMVYRAIYDFWAYGCNVDEEFYLHFDEMTHAEKSEYLADCMRNVYFNHLNDNGNPDLIDLLSDKYRLYRRLQPYYLRDMVELRTEEDYPVFEAFVKKHDVFVVKPSNYFAGHGVHKASLADYGNDIRASFVQILGEGNAIHEQHPSRNAKMVLEELIVQDESLSKLHPDSVNAIRATAVRGKDGKIHLYHPWIKVGLNGTFVASAVLNGFDAEIDPKTGVVITEGYQESGHTYAIHPDSDITIKGFQIPKWTEMVELVDKLMAELPQYGYIGWDLVLTPKGWCVMEGNYYADFMFQLIHKRGFKKEFEELIGWKYEKDFWWQNHLK